VLGAGIWQLVVIFSRSTFVKFNIKHPAYWSRRWTFPLCLYFLVQQPFSGRDEAEDILSELNDDDFEGAFMVLPLSVMFVCTCFGFQGCHLARAHLQFFLQQPPLRQKCFQAAERPKAKEEAR
jgi:hypothetical protein